MPSQKISEMPLVQSGYIQSSYLEFPILHPDAGVPGNHRLRYADLREQLRQDGLGGSPQRQIAMYKMTPRSAPSVGNVFTNWTITQIMASDELEWNGSFFQLHVGGIFKISCVVNMRITDSYGNNDTIWPSGVSEVGTYLNRDSYYAANLLPNNKSDRTSHNRYVQGFGYDYTQRPFQMWTDEFFIDFTDTTQQGRGRFLPGAFLATTTGVATPWPEIAMTVMKVGDHV
jgi:hypothetical protein